TEMIAKGVDVCRLNFSHGSQSDHLKVIETINAINDEHGFNVGILADLQGPKIRIGMMIEGGANMVNGSIVEMTTKELIGDEKRVYITYENFPNDVKAGEIILRSEEHTS